MSSAILAEAGAFHPRFRAENDRSPYAWADDELGMIYQAHILGKWWAYFPVILVIALISFSMNLMNTGLDQVFNPALRD